MLPTFGFSTGDFVTAIGLINDFRKALRDSGGSKDDFLLLLQDLEQVQIVLEQLKDGVWGSGGDVGHVNAVRAMALTVQTPLKDFLLKIEKYRCMASGARGVKMHFASNARKMQWAVAMREDVSRLRAVIATKLLNMSLLLALPAASTLPRLESRLKAIQDSTVEMKAGLSAKIGDCQDANAQAMQDVQQMSEQNVTASAATTGQLSRLVEICAGVSIGVKDFRCILQNYYPRVDQRLERIEELQCQTLTSIPTATQRIAAYFDRVIDILRPLLGAFQGFSAKALELLERMLQTNLETHALLLRLQGQIPQSLIMPTHTLFYFQDVLGRNHELPYGWFRHWDIFAAMLKHTFRGLPGEEYVSQNRYYLRMSGRDHRRIRPGTWDKNVFPGTKVQMSIQVPGSQHTMSCACCGCSRISENLQEGEANVDAIDVVSLAICPVCGLKQYIAQVSPNKATRWIDETEAATNNDAERQKIKLGDLELFKCVQVQYETQAPQNTLQNWRLQRKSSLSPRSRYEEEKRATRERGRQAHANRLARAASLSPRSRYEEEKRATRERERQAHADRLARVARLEQSAYDRDVRLAEDERRNKRLEFGERGSIRRQQQEEEERYRRREEAERWTIRRQQQEEEDRYRRGEEAERWREEARRRGEEQEERIHLRPLSRASMRRHIQTERSDRRPRFPCPAGCGATLNRADNVKKHVNSRHR